MVLDASYYRRVYWRYVGWDFGGIVIPDTDVKGSGTRIATFRHLLQPRHVHQLHIAYPIGAGVGIGINIDCPNVDIKTTKYQAI